MDAAPAARIILKGIAARRREVNFPRPMAWLMALARGMPNPWYDRLLGRIVLGRGRPARARGSGAGDQ